MAWLPAMVGVAVICCESTGLMSSANTGRWLMAVCHWLGVQTDEATIGTINLVLRKLGHFCGYGTLALLFRRGWFYSLQMSGSRSSLRWISASLGVVCTFLVACMDELHQHFLLRRTSSFHDVLIDTAGAIVFNVIFIIVVMRRAPLERSVPSGV